MTDIFSAPTASLIENELNDYFVQATQRAERVSPSYERLWKSLHSLHTSGGKRFRPHMTVLAYELFGGESVANIVPVAAAQELLHFSLLIHDDIIDRDYVRYGVPNIAGSYEAFYKKEFTSEAEVRHFAQGAAILAGDLMIAGAHELIMKSRATDAQKTMAHELLSQSIFDVAGGELLDTEASFLPVAAGDALKIALYKTARYSFVIPLVTGAKLAGADQKAEMALRRYAEAVGIAYQLVDDLLSVFGVEEETGKSNSGDIREGKHTLLVEFAMQAMSTNDKILFNQAFGNAEGTPEAINQAKALLISSGGRQRVERTIAEHKHTAEAAIEELGLSADKAQKLHMLLRLVLERNA